MICAATCQFCLWKEVGRLRVGIGWGVVRATIDPIVVPRGESSTFARSGSLSVVNRHCTPPQATALGAEAAPVDAETTGVANDAARTPMIPTRLTGFDAAPARILVPPGDGCLGECRGRDSNPHAPEEGHLILSQARLATFATPARAG